MGSSDTAAGGARPKGLEEKLRQALLAGKSTSQRPGSGAQKGIPPPPASLSALSSAGGAQKRSRSPGSSGRYDAGLAAGSSSLAASLESLWKRTHKQQVQRQQQQGTPGHLGARGVPPRNEEAQNGRSAAVASSSPFLAAGSLTDGSRMDGAPGSGATADSSALFTSLMDELMQVEAQFQQKGPQEGPAGKAAESAVLPLASAEAALAAASLAPGTELSMEQALELLGEPPGAAVAEPGEAVGLDGAKQEESQRVMLQSFMVDAGEGDAVGMEDFLRGLDGLSSAFGELGDLLPALPIPGAGPAEPDALSVDESAGGGDGDGEEFMAVLQDILRQHHPNAVVTADGVEGLSAAVGPTEQTTGVHRGNGGAADQGDGAAIGSMKFSAVHGSAIQGPATQGSGSTLKGAAKAQTPAAAGQPSEQLNLQDRIAQTALHKITNECEKRKAELAAVEHKAVLGEPAQDLANLSVASSSSGDSSSVGKGTGPVFAYTASSSSSHSQDLDASVSSAASRPKAQPHAAPWHVSGAASGDGHGGAPAPSLYTPQRTHDPSGNGSCECSTCSCPPGAEAEAEAAKAQALAEKAAADKGNEDPIQLLIQVARAIVSGDQAVVHALLSRLNQVASVYGDVSQRLSAYFLEGLLARLAGTAPKHNPDPFGVEPFLPTPCPDEKGTAPDQQEPCSSAQGPESGSLEGAQPVQLDRVKEAWDCEPAEATGAAAQDDQGEPAAARSTEPGWGRMEAGMRGRGKGGCNFGLLESFQVLVNSSPFLTFGQVAANSAILEAIAGESHVHIIDFGIGHALQWPALLQALAARPGGPPHVRLTGIETPHGGPRRPYCVYKAGARLTVTARMWGVPFMYYSLPSKLEDVRVDMLKLQRGEAVVVNCALRLSQLLDESATPGADPRTAVLRTIRAAEPKLCVLVEQVSNHNSPFFLARFYEALYYYALLFESMDASLPRNVTARRIYEEQVLGRAIVNLVACEGQERVERQEPLWSWKQRMQRAGFKEHPVTDSVVDTARALLATYNKVGHEVMREDEGSIVLAWKERPLLAMTAWEIA